MGAVKIVDSIVVRAGVVSLRSDQIIVQQIKDDYVVDVNDLKEIGAAVVRLGKGKKFPNLILAAPFSDITKEARDYSTSEENNKYTIADAFVIKSAHQKLVANLYLKINQPTIPTRFFDNEEEAVEWLKKFL